ncbi:hypothetical protein ACFODZ_07800 [Marinicella sediminis]|uniref:Uncharacterized protein n=1 Tax=Marinicella sediminis TaxID=1792834 RepID=A0ABV7JBV7_9GAMM|nr:hypothetical protein [Marinicella sediminis]
MKINVRLLEKIGQSQSVHQVTSITQMANKFGVSQYQFKKMIKQNQDMVCLLLPDDDDDANDAGDDGEE